MHRSPRLDMMTRAVAVALVVVRTGGTGPAVVLLHGYGETGDMWAPLAVRLAPRYTVIVPDLRGMGLSARPGGGYDKKNQGQDIVGVLDALKIEKADLVTHDIGNMVGYALAAEYPSGITRFVLIDAPPPGIGFEQFKAFDQDARDDSNVVAKGKLPMPVLAVGGEKSFGPQMAEIMRFAATNGEQGIVHGSGH